MNNNKQNPYEAALMESVAALQKEVRKEPLSAERIASLSDAITALLMAFVETRHITH